MRKYIIYLIPCILVLMANPVFAKAPMVGDKAPDFSLVSVTGDKVSLSSFKGKVVLVGMFHICVPCMNQAMEFNKVREAVKSEDLVILGVNTSGDSKQAVMDYLKGFPKQVDFSYLLDEEQTVNKAYIQRDMPTVLIIDREGIIRVRAPGVGSDQLVPFLQKLL